jgi:hypothetical protein
MTELRTLGEEPILRMIDGLPALPDEQPSDTWQELRITVTGGMVTIRRGPSAWTCVVLGNANAEQLRSLDQCCTAITRACERS